MKISVMETAKFVVMLAALVCGTLVCGTSDKLQAFDKEKINVYEDGGGIVLMGKDGPQRLTAPKGFNDSNQFVVRIHRPEEALPAPKAAREPTQVEKIEARKSTFDANQAFFKGDLEKAWDLLEKAEALDPGYFRIKSMRGSLMYRMGAKDMAIALWEQSLSVNPDQPEIREYLQKTKEELKQ